MPLLQKVRHTASSGFVALRALVDLVDPGTTLGSTLCDLGFLDTRDAGPGRDDREVSAGLVSSSATEDKAS